MANQDNLDQENRGAMTVAEAGKRGGDATRRTHGHEFYSKIGHMGGQKVRRLIRQAEEQSEAE